jgi:hypothetical protein
MADGTLAHCRTVVAFRLQHDGLQFCRSVRWVRIAEANEAGKKVIWPACFDEALAARAAGRLRKELLVYDISDQTPRHDV